jgi:hypothetical protein
LSSIVAAVAFVPCTSCPSLDELTAAELPARMVGMSKALPGWVVDDVASVRAELAEWAGLSAQDLWRLERLCARDAMWAARASGNPGRALDYVDPLPESTVRALERLRNEAKRRDGDR